MRALHRRLLRIEDRFCRPVETEYKWQLQRRIEAGRRRVAAAQGETYVLWRPSGTVAGLTLAGYDTVFGGRTTLG